MKKCSLLLFSLLVSLFFVVACNHSNKGNEANKDNEGTESDAPLSPEVVSIEEAKTIIEKHKGNKNFVILDVRTDGEFKEGYLQGHLYTEDTEDDDLAGVVQHDFYAPDFDQWISTLDKAKRYLIHCRTQVRSKVAFDKMKALGFKKIQYMYGGYTDWAKAYPNQLRKPKYELAVDIQIKCDKIKTKDTIKFDFLVTNLQGDPLRKAELEAKVMSDNTEVEKTSLKTGNDGTTTHTFDATGKTKGTYRLVCTGTHKSTEGADYKPVEAYYYFEVADQDEAVSGSKDEIATNDEIGLTAKVIEKFYNRNVYGYQVYDNTATAVSLGKSVNKDKPTLLILFSPLCGGCMVKAQELDKYKLDSINLLPVLTSIDESDLQAEIKKNEKKLKDDFHLDSMVPLALYDAKDKIWGSRFNFLVTPIFILINKEGQIKDIIYQFEKGEKEEVFIQKLLKKMETKFGLSQFTTK